MGNTALNPTQSNTNKGPAIQAVSAASLAGKEGFLAVLSDNAGVREANLPTTSDTDALALYLIDDGGDASGDTVDLSALHAGEQFRIRLNGVITAGARVVVDTTAGNEGKVKAVPATAGVYFSPGTAEEAGVDEQYVLVRANPELIVVATTVDLGNANGEISGVALAAETSTNGTAAAAAADLAALAAEAEKIGDDTRDVRAKFATLVTKLEELADDVRAIHAAQVAAGDITVTP